MCTPIDKLPTMNLGCTEIINISHTNLTDLDAKPLSQLRELYISGRKITNVDFSDCTRLAKLIACKSKLIVIEIKNCLFKFPLKELILSDSPVEHVKVNMMLYLEKLWIDGT